MIANAVILLDFDNVFITLWELDREAAFRFASNPADWLEVLANTHLAQDARRWLVSRCYLNPAGYVNVGAEPNERLYFSRFRPGLVRAGFEVIDCPALGRGGKNAADIRMVIDAMDLLDHRTRFDEFVLASGDSDFTPLLQKLRAEDRRITIVSPGYMSAAYTSLADSIVGFEELRALVFDEADQLQPGYQGQAQRSNEQASPAAVSSKAAFASFLRQKYSAATGPLNLASLAAESARGFQDAKLSDWYGHGSFIALLSVLGLPNARFSQHHLWDEERHQPPPQTVPSEPVEQPEPVELLSRALDLPRVKREHWPKLFGALATYAESNQFNLTDATRSCRDALAAEGVHVGRAAIGYVAQGCQFGGASLDASVPPDAETLAKAFLSALLDRARSMGVALDVSREREVAEWLGVPF